MVDVVYGEELCGSVDLQRKVLRLIRGPWWWLIVHVVSRS